MNGPGGLQSQCHLTRADNVFSGRKSLSWFFDMIIMNKKMMLLHIHVCKLGYSNWSHDSEMNHYIYVLFCFVSIVLSLLFSSLPLLPFSLSGLRFTSRLCVFPLVIISVILLASHIFISFRTRNIGLSVADFPYFLSFKLYSLHSHCSHISHSVVATSTCHSISKDVYRPCIHFSRIHIQICVFMEINHAASGKTLAGNRHSTIMSLFQARLTSPNYFSAGSH